MVGNAVCLTCSKVRSQTSATCIRATSQSETSGTSYFICVPCIKKNRKLIIEHCVHASKVGQMRAVHQSKPCLQGLGKLRVYLGHMRGKEYVIPCPPLTLPTFNMPHQNDSLSDRRSCPESRGEATAPRSRSPLPTPPLELFEMRSPIRTGSDPPPLPRTASVDSCGLRIATKKYKKHGGCAKHGCCEVFAMYAKISRMQTYTYIHCTNTALMEV